MNNNLLIGLALVIGLIIFLFYQRSTVEGFKCPDWFHKSGLIQEGECCNTNDDCMIKYQCIKGQNKCGSYGTCQRPKGDTDQCRSIGWNSSYNGLCIN